MIRLLLGLFFFLINMSLNLFSNSEYYYGACDASATVLLDENTILVADDEDNLLRLYSIKRKGLPIKTFSLNKRISYSVGFNFICFIYFLAVTISFLANSL